VFEAHVIDKRYRLDRMGRLWKVHLGKRGAPTAIPTKMDRFVPKMKAPFGIRGQVVTGGSQSNSLSTYPDM
jgi:hypothetical protein